MRHSQRCMENTDMEALKIKVEKNKKDRKRKYDEQNYIENREQKRKYYQENIEKRKAYQRNYDQKHQQNHKIKGKFLKKCIRSEEHVEVEHCGGMAPQ